MEDSRDEGIAGSGDEQSRDRSSFMTEGKGGKSGSWWVDEDEERRSAQGSKGTGPEIAGSLQGRDEDDDWADDLEYDDLDLFQWTPSKRKTRYNTRLFSMVIDATTRTMVVSILILQMPGS